MYLTTCAYVLLLNSV